eukprot:CAMPEP_0117877090 /NCGR_PEP_ID=MMETSP0950-20121206/13979_1 /TAXON_ID=44440 /ORGANISM="Chattonella subsalsa, Strain CCMP2191" /LENGTH=604 /DNA_ID=CAMNT_0005731003 /DNA_START=6 /DNA_END=1821 /DNA_ORIENTATION=-
MSSSQKKGGLQALTESRKDKQKQVNEAPNSDSENQEVENIADKGQKKSSRRKSTTKKHKNNNQGSEEEQSHEEGSGQEIDKSDGGLKQRKQPKKKKEKDDSGSDDEERAEDDADATTPPKREKKKGRNGKGSSKKKPNMEESEVSDEGQDGSKKGKKKTMKTSPSAGSLKRGLAGLVSRKNKPQKGESQQPSDREASDQEEGQSSGSSAGSEDEQEKEKIKKKKERKKKAPRNKTRTDTKSGADGEDAPEEDAANKSKSRKGMLRGLGKSFGRRKTSKNVEEVEDEEQESSESPKSTKGKKKKGIKSAKGSESEEATSESEVEEDKSKLSRKKHRRKKKKEKEAEGSDTDAERERGRSKSSARSRLKSGAVLEDPDDTDLEPPSELGFMRGKPALGRGRNKPRRKFRDRVTADKVPEVTYLGEVVGGWGFIHSSSSGLFCKWTIDFGRHWKTLGGEVIGQTHVVYPLSTADAEEGTQALYSWNHPIDIHLSTITSIQGGPRMSVQVYSLDIFGRSSIIGYGFAHLPLTPGLSVITIPCWRPTKSIRDEISAFFLGITPRLVNEEVVFSKAWDQRCRLTTLPSGKVSISLNTILRYFEEHKVDIV